MAIFLTIGFVEVLTHQNDLGAGLVWLFLQQMGIGALVGLASGWLAVRLINRIDLGTAGLYPVLSATCGFVAFGLAAVLGGSGFLSIYLAGIVLGNSRVVFQRGTLLFVDGLAWIGQIAMFVVLGLLSTPSELVTVAGPSLAVSAVLVLVARPLAVFPLLWPFGFAWNELVLVSWVGLKGAVPIILATFPLMFAVPGGRLIFDVVFFVVLVSATLQGSTLPWLSRRLGLHEPRPPAAAVSLELLALRELKADVIEYRVEEGAPLAGRLVRDLDLPEGAVLAVVARGRSLVAPRGATRIDAGDHLFVIARGPAGAGGGGDEGA
jgi:cell volume regulation protein A